MTAISDPSLLEHLERADAVARLQRLVARARQAGVKDAPNRGLVVDQQHELPRAAGADGGRHTGCRLVRGALGGQVDAKLRTALRPRADVDEAAVPFHDAEHRREAEPGPLIEALGREERVEDPAQVLGGDTGAGVAHLEHRVPSQLGAGVQERRLLVELDEAHHELERPPVRHGVARVHAQVHQHLVELRRIGHDLGVRLDLASTLMFFGNVSRMIARISSTTEASKRGTRSPLVPRPKVSSWRSTFAPRWAFVSMVSRSSIASALRSPGARAPALSRWARGCCSGRARRRLPAAPSSRGDRRAAGAPRARASRAAGALARARS